MEASPWQQSSRLVASSSNQVAATRGEVVLRSEGNTATPLKLIILEDCMDEDGVKGRCVAGGINNYTSQLLTYGRSSSPEYNLTQALLFLSHFIGDINKIDVLFFMRVFSTVADHSTIDSALN